MFNKKDKRFKVISEEGAVNSVRILQDLETGVNYLFATSGYAGGLTPLLDRDGNVVVTAVVED